MNPPSDNRSLGDFQPAAVWQTHVNAIFYGLKGPEIHHHFQTFVSRDYRLAHALAEDLWAGRERLPAGETVYVLEMGVGNGNLAACLLNRLRELDPQAELLPRLRYVLCDYSWQILAGARAHPLLEGQAPPAVFLRADAERLDALLPGRIHKILSNEIWDDLATRVVLKHDGLFYEEYLQPTLPPRGLRRSFEEVAQAFARRDLEILAGEDGLLEAIHWERSWQRVDFSDWPFAEVLQEHLRDIHDDIPVPVNTGAFRTLERARRLLAPAHLGYTGFDYGMLGLEELNREGRPYFRIYGGQYTNMVNFPLLEAVGRALGFGQVIREPQAAFVSRRLGEPVISAVDLVQAHPGLRRMQPWDVDRLMIQTLHALNAHYRSPYRNKLDYPPVPGTPKKQRRQLAELVRRLSAAGVPDTVAYITQSEVEQAAAGLRKLGYREADLRAAFQAPPPPVAFAHLSLA